MIFTLKNSTQLHYKNGQANRLTHIFASNSLRTDRLDLFCPGVGSIWHYQQAIALSAWQCARAINATHPFANQARQMLLNAVQDE